MSDYIQLLNKLGEMLQEGTLDEVGFQHMDERAWEFYIECNN